MFGYGKNVTHLVEPRLGERFIVTFGLRHLLAILRILTSL